MFHILIAGSSAPADIIGKLSGFEITAVSETEECIKEVLAGGYDAAVLYAPGSDTDIFNLCKNIRKDSHIPIMIITESENPEDIIKAFESGADDSVCSIIRTDELSARIEGHIRIHEMLDDAVMPVEKEYDFGRLRICPSSRRVFVSGKEIELPNKEFELLAYFAEHPDEVFSRKFLFEKIWGQRPVGNTATVMVHINRIRDKIEKDPSEPQYIQTVWGAGYRFSSNSQEA